MATNHTEHCWLSQWEPGDQVLRTDFNADYKKIDAVLEKLERTVEEHTRYLNLCGNCQIHMMSYVGNDNSAVLVIRPNEVCNVVGRTDISGPSFRWNGNTVTWFHADSENQMNSPNMGYNVFALLSCDK